MASNLVSNIVTPQIPNPAKADVDIRTKTLKRVSSFDYYLQRDVFNKSYCNKWIYEKPSKFSKEFSSEAIFIITFVSHFLFPPFQVVFKARKQTVAVLKL